MNDSPPSTRFHHIGVCCRSVEREIKSFELLGYSIVGESFNDPIQGIHGLFMEGEGPRIELVAPLKADDPGVLGPWLERGAKMYHLAYEAADMRATLDWIQSKRGKVIVDPVPAVAFDNRKIAFVVLPNMMLAEYIEQG